MPGFCFSATLPATDFSTAGATGAVEAAIELAFRILPNYPATGAALRGSQ